MGEWDGGRLGETQEGLYPLEYARGISTAGTAAIITTCPNGVYRKIVQACVYTNTNLNNGVVCVLGVRKANVDYYLLVGSRRGPATNSPEHVIQLPYPIILSPGDSLICNDLNAIAAISQTGTCAYYDIKIDAPTFKKGRRG